MSTSKTISLLLLLCFALHQCSSTTQVCSFWKGVYYPAQWRRLVFDRYAFQSSKLLYAVCDPSSTGRTCSVIRDKDEPLLGSNYTCSIDLKPSLKNGVIVERFRVVPFGDDRAILVWLEKTNTEKKLVLTSVRFSDCSTYEVRVNGDSALDDALYDVKLVTYQHTYDALYIYNRVCGLNYCKLNVDVEANKVTGPTPSLHAQYPSRLADIKALDSADKGAVAIQHVRNGGRFFILQGSDEKMLKSYPMRGITTEALATTNELIAFCHLSGGELGCAQYDQSGTTIVESKNHVQNNLNLVAVHNLRGGDGLFALFNDKAQGHLHVLRLDMKGNQVGTIDVDKFQCDQSLNEVAGHFWEKDEQYCVSLACYETEFQSLRKSDKGHLSAAAKCFTLRDLKPIA